MTEPRDHDVQRSGATGGAHSAPEPGPEPAAGFGQGRHAQGSGSAPLTGSGPGPASGASTVSGPGSASEAPTSRIPHTVGHRDEGRPGGLSTAPSGAAAGDATPVVAQSYRRGPLQSVLVVRRIDPWSTFTTVLGLMFALFLVWMVAVGVVYLLLKGMGVWDRLGGLLSGVAGDSTAAAVDAGQIFLYAGAIGLLNVLLFSVLSTLGVFIYNLAAGLTGGGIQVTLADRTERGD